MSCASDVPRCVESAISTLLFKVAQLLAWVVLPSTVEVTKGPEYVPYDLLTLKILKAIATELKATPEITSGIEEGSR